MIVASWSFIDSLTSSLPFSSEASVDIQHTHVHIMIIHYTCTYMYMYMCIYSVCCSNSAADLQLLSVGGELK